MTMKENTLNPPFLYKMFILFILITVLIPWTWHINFPYNLGGSVLSLAGIIMAAGTKRMFRKTQTPMNPRATPDKLHTSGIFRYTRNPMYLGIVLGLSGIAVMTGIILNLIFPIFYMIIMNKFFIPIEEKNLEKTFGDQYREYREIVGRWI